MPVVLGDPNQGGFHIPDLTRAYQQHSIVNLNPDRGGGGGGGGGGPNLDAMVFAAQNQQQRAIEQANLHAWVNQQDLTAHEQMRLQQQQNALSYVMSDPNISDEKPEEGGMSERDRLAFQIRTNIDPLRQRLEAAQERRTQQMFQHQMQQDAQAQTRANGDAAYWTQHHQSRLFTANGEPVSPDNPAIGVYGPDGKPNLFRNDSSGNQEDKARAEHEKQWHAMMSQSSRTAAQELVEANKPPPSEEAILNRARSIMQNRHGLAPFLGEHMQAYDASHPSRHRRPGPPPNRGEVSQSEQGRQAFEAGGGRLSSNVGASLMDDLNRAEEAARARIAPSSPAPQAPPQETPLFQGAVG